MGTAWTLVRASVVLVGACESTPATPDAATDAGTDAPLDAAVRTISIDQTLHHLGDTIGGDPETPEGSMWSSPFMVGACGGATLELDFVPPWGPQAATPPTVQINGTALASVITFFPPNLCLLNDCDFDTGRVHVVLDCAAALVSGANTVAIVANPGDDFFFRAVELRCSP